MNPRTREILSVLLKDPSMWNNKTGEPDLIRLHRFYFRALEMQWDNEVFWPKYFRAARLFHALTTEETRKDHFSWLKEPFGEGWIVEPCERDGCMVQWCFSAWFEERLTDYHVAHEEEWAADTLYKETVMQFAREHDLIPTWDPLRKVWTWDEPVQMTLF